MNATKIIICAQDLVSNPPAIIIWTNPEGEIVKNGGRYSYKSSISGPEDVALKINRVNEKDNGTWNCTIIVKYGENEINRRVITVELDVDGAGRTSGPQIIIVVTSILGVIVIIIIAIPRPSSKISKISKPKVSQTFQDGVEITWTKLGPNAEKVTSYVVSYRSETDPPGQWSTQDASETKLRVKGMLVKVEYKFKVCALCRDATGPESEESDSIIIPKPQIADKIIGKPYASQITHNSVTLKWESCDKGAQDYTILYHALDESTDENWKECMVNTDTNCELIVGLKPQTRYVFKVQLDSRTGEPIVSDISDPIVTEATVEDKAKTRKSLAESLKLRSTKISPPGSHPDIYYPATIKLDDKCIIAVGTNKLINEFQMPMNERVLMLVGATGAGKSTLINGIANYVVGVRWQDDFRFKVIVDEGEKSQAHSQTSKITAYTFHDSNLPYTLTIIDTPGFGDTRGIENDKIIVEQIRALFSLGSIDQIHGVGFVTQASDPRLTPTMQYIFDSILSIFGKDIGSNIFLLITFADDQEPPVLSAIKEAAIPYKADFKFNNSALFAKYSVGTFGEMFWGLGMENLDHFFREFEKVEPHSLQLTRENLNERQQLEAVIEGLKMQIKVCLTKIDVLRQKHYILRKREAEILQNQHFTYEVIVTKQRKIKLPRDVFVTNCQQCEFTCHYPCPVSNDNEKYRCKAMDGGGPDSACCTVCPGNCRWSHHVNESHRFETYYEVETQTSDNLKQNLVEAIEGKSQIESTIVDIEKELDMLQGVIVGMVSEAKRCLERLQEIALKPNPLNEIEYIDLLIKAENSEKSPGFTERVRAFETIKDIVKKQSELASEKKTNSIWWKNIMARK